MAEAKVTGTFISEKVSKIRWITEQYAEPNSFLTGSWGFDQNFIKLWKLILNEYSDDDTNEYVPKCKAKFLYSGDTSGLEFVDNDNFVVGSSDGFISVVGINRKLEENNISEKYRFKDLHKFENNIKAPCTALSTYEGDIASVGEDGRLNILSAKNQRIIRTYNEADSITMTSVSFINHNEILTGNRMGTIKMFDSRSDAEENQITLLISCQDDKKSNCVNCITYHPTKKHIVLGGSEEGSITVWDLRKPNCPASYFTAHNRGISELAFHKTQPTKVFSSSDGGELWQWNQNDTQFQSFDMDPNKKFSDIDPWLNGERAKNKFNVISLIEGITKSINSFDVFDTKIICGCDNEAIYLIENMY